MQPTQSPVLSTPWTLVGDPRVMFGLLVSLSTVRFIVRRLVQGGNSPTTTKVKNLVTTSMTMKLSSATLCAHSVDRTADSSFDLDLVWVD